MYAEQVRQRLEKQLHRRAKELGFEVVRKAEPVRVNANLRPAMDSIAFLVAVGPHDAVVVAVAGDVAKVDVQLPIVTGVGGKL